MRGNPLGHYTAVLPCVLEEGQRACLIYLIPAILGRHCVGSWMCFGLDFLLPCILQALFHGGSHLTQFYLAFFFFFFWQVFLVWSGASYSQLLLCTSSELHFFLQLFLSWICSGSLQWLRTRLDWTELGVAGLQSGTCLLAFSLPEITTSSLFLSCHLPSGVFLCLKWDIT